MHQNASAPSRAAPTDPRAVTLVFRCDGCARTVFLPRGAYRSPPGRDLCPGCVRQRVGCAPADAEQ